MDGVTRRETTIIIPVPAAEPLVAGWRAIFDPSSEAGVPAHITVLYPFLDAHDVDDGVIDDLRRLFHAIHAFAFSLAAVKRLEPPVLYLDPRPAAPFVHLTMHLWGKYPDHPPYGGRYRHVVPHLTVAEGTRAHPGQMDALERELQPKLPIHAVAERAVLLEQEAPGGHWRERAQLPFAH